MDKYNKKNKDKYNKIRKLLGKDYHLCTGIRLSSDDELEISWSLCKYYDDIDLYVSKDNKPIMTSKTHTSKQLYDFAKKHHKIDIYKTTNIVMLCFASFALVLSTINLFLSNSIIRAIVCTINFTALVEVFILSIVQSKNCQVDIRNSIENFKKIEMKGNK